MDRKKVYAALEEVNTVRMNAEINRLAEEHEEFSVESVTYNGAGGLALFYSYTIEEEDSWFYDGGQTNDWWAVDEPTFPPAFRPAARRRGYTDYSWS